MKNIIDLRPPPPSVNQQISDEYRKDSEEEISGEIHAHQQTVHKPAAIIIAVIFVLIGLTYLYFQKNILTAIFFFLIALIILLFTFKEKRPVVWAVTRHGVSIGSSFFPYQELKSFWIEYQPGYIKEISIKSKKWYHGYWKISLDQENPLKIRERLLEFLPEEKHEDTLVETISRKLGI